MSTATDPLQLAEPLGTLVRYAIVQARKTGRTVTLVSGRRSEAEQIDLRRAHCGTSHWAIYEAPSSSCNPPTARPGTSKHQSGEAADLSGAKEYTAALLSKYNVTRPVTGEDWHFEWHGTNASADLQALANELDSAGWTNDELAEVFGTQPGTIPGGGDTGGTSITTLVVNGLSWVIRTPLGIASSAAGTISDATGAIASIARFFTAIASKLTDPSWWKRVGLGLLGAILIYAGGQLVMSDILDIGSIVKEVAG